jgi:hypothetical protein
VGQYEYVPAGVGTSGTSFVAGATLQNTYVQANPTATTPRRSFQVIRVPQYGNLTLGGTLTGLAWNGTNGGVLALDVAKTLAFNGQTIDMAARGFRGGGGRQSTVNSNNPQRSREGDGLANASKGEGIAGTPRYLWVDDSPFDRATIVGTYVDSSAQAMWAIPAPAPRPTLTLPGVPRATRAAAASTLTATTTTAAAVAAATAAPGGRGAFGWRSAGLGHGAERLFQHRGGHRAAPGGLWCRRLWRRQCRALVLGGGGGAGDENGNSGDTNGPLSRGRTSGATGGGLVMIRAGSLTGNGTIDVRGGSPTTSRSTTRPVVARAVAAWS